jgi:beta-glucanase (GH16 family)
MQHSVPAKKAAEALCPSSAYGGNVKKLSAAIALALLAQASSGAAGENQLLDIEAYVMTFEDGFDRLSVSDWGPGTTWIAHTPWNGDFGDAKFANPREDFPFTLSNGILKIEMLKDSEGTWRSGLLASVDSKGKGFSQKYGYFEIRSKFPPGEGVWPAFWLIGVERLGPDPKATAEIDIVEYYGRNPGAYSSSVHVWPKDKSIKKFTQTGKTQVEPGVLSQDFHLYGASVDPDKIRFYLDRKEVWSIDTPDQHKQPMFMLFNLGLGSGWPTENTPNPSVMEVDYVRAYARK